MTKARITRLKLQKIRVEAEKERELSHGYPAVSSGEVGKVVQKSREMLQEVSSYIRSEANNM